MNSQKCRFTVIMVLAASLLSFSVSGLGEVQMTPEQKALVGLMKVDPSLGRQVTDKNIQEAMLLSLAKQIAADFEGMKLLFEAKEFCCLAKLLGKRGANLTTPGFEKICGGGSAEFWESVWKEGEELNFVPVSIVVSSAINPQPVPLCTLIQEGGPLKDEKGDTIKYNAVAFITLEYHIAPKVKGTGSHNQTGMGTATYLHKTICPWG